MSVGAQEAAQGSDVQDTELAEVLVDLQIVPGRPAHKTAIDAVQAWTGLEKQEGVRNRSACRNRTTSFDGEGERVIRSGGSF